MPRILRLVIGALAAPAIPPLLYVVLMLSFSGYFVNAGHYSKFFGMIPYFFLFSFFWSAVAAIPSIALTLFNKRFATGAFIIPTYALSLGVCALAFALTNGPPAEYNTSTTVLVAQAASISLIAALGSLLQSVPFTLIAGLPWIGE